MDVRGNRSKLCEFSSLACEDLFALSGVQGKDDRVVEVLLCGKPARASCLGSRMTSETRERNMLQ